MGPELTVQCSVRSDQVLFAVKGGGEDGGMTR